MQFTFTTGSAAEAARILEALGVAAQRDYLPAEAGAEADDWGADQAGAESDPWADDASGQRQERRSGQSGGAASDDKGEAKIPRSGSHWVETDNGKRLWTFGRDDAPACECGMTAALVEGKTNGSKWGRWTCPLKFSRDTYKGACNLSVWASKK